ncbi:hypothetical protein CAEBREN_17448 [Caenorhabditis brenneri]|uniref:Uncharacterized protein n=1 Tax=Caenorhabditis brenneri TaxID=135651 RepID=G0MCX4_CAEBE|nr:hypothetical protein CAEBREN_17448 [Caenorhabditis brenneri]
MTPPPKGPNDSTNGMTPDPAMTPSTTPFAMALPSTDPSDFQNQMMTPPTTAVSPSMAPVTMTPSTMTKPPSMNATPPTPSSEGSQDFQNPMWTIPSSAYDYTWNPQYGTWDMSQKAGGVPVPQWNVNQGVDDFQNSQQFQNPGNV